MTQAAVLAGLNKVMIYECQCGNRHEEVVPAEAPVYELKQFICNKCPRERIMLRRHEFREVSNAGQRKRNDSKK